MDIRRRARHLIQALGHRRWFAALARPVLARVERTLFRATRGRLVPTSTVAPVLLLTTTGRRTGRPRTTPLIYLPDGDRLVVSSEDFGSERPAAWPRNLDADPLAWVELPGGVHRLCLARRLDEAEADAYWPRLLEQWPAHATYRERSGARHTFALEPAEAPTR
ncbi:MAG TPA: nitroreductase/quinone reductase family protein [Solirubrobacteraceae bacterium]